MSSSHIFNWHDVVTREREWCTSVVDAYSATGIILSESTLDLRALRAITHEVALASGVLPLAVVEDSGGGWQLYVATACPLAPAIVAALEQHTQRRVVVVLAAAPLLPSAITAAYRAAANGAQLLAGLRVTSLAAVHLELVRPSVIHWLEPVAE